MGFSVVTPTTLGYGEISPVNSAFRLPAPVEAMVGFALLTPGLTWFLLLYLNLSRQRSLAHRVWPLREAEDESGVSAEATELALGDLLPEVMARLFAIRRDPIEFPISYYFHDTDTESSPPSTLPYLLHLFWQPEEPRNPGSLRLRAAILHGAVEDLVSTLVTLFLRLSATAPVEEILDAYARDHTPVARPRRVSG